MYSRLVISDEQMSPVDARRVILIDGQTDSSEVISGELTFGFYALMTSFFAIFTFLGWTTYMTRRREKEYNANNYTDILNTIKIFDMDRPLNHIKKIEVVKGDISKTIPSYLKKNKQQTVRILHLGMNLYLPTYNSLKYFLPRMVKGSIVAIDGLNHATPGCLEALKGNIDLTKVNLRTFDYYPNFTYFTI
jgi:hypothetical protein